MKKLCMGIIVFCSFSLSAVTFYEIDTTTPLQCYLSSKFQNRIMVDKGRIKKVITSEYDQLSIHMEEMTGQAFIYAREPNPRETSISIVSDSGVIQDLHIQFIDRMAEVVILKDSEGNAEKNELQVTESCSLDQIAQILKGNIPPNYIPSSISYTKWIPKKGIELELKTKLEGPDDIIYIYQTTNTLKRTQTIQECELECKGSQWVFLEKNILKPKQTTLSIISVFKHE